MGLDQFNTKQLIALWYGGLLACLLLGMFALAENSVAAAVLAILLLTGLAVYLLGEHPNAEETRVYRWSFGLSAGLTILAGLTLGFLAIIKSGEQPRFSIYPYYPLRNLDSLNVTTPQVKIEYPIEFSRAIVYRRPSGDTSEATRRDTRCVEIRGNFTNESQRVLEGLRFEVTIQDTLGNLLSDPQPGWSILTAAPGEKRDFRVVAPLPCMTGPNRQYRVSLTKVRLRN